MRRPARRALLAALVSSGLASLAASPPAAPASPLVREEAVPLDPARPELAQTGELEYLGGVALFSDDARFGGFSSLHVDSRGGLLAVSDAGRVLTGRIVEDERGRLVGLRQASLAALPGLRGRPLWDKVESDSESLAPLADGSFLLGFERNHRIWRYRQSGGRLVRPVPVAGPSELRNAPANQGLEALARLADGRVLALTEGWEEEAAAVRGWVGRPGAWSRVTYPVEGYFRPSDATGTPAGDLLVLERSYDPDRVALGARLRLVRAADIRPDARLAGRLVAEIQPPLTTDNYEGVACVRGADGRTRVFVISDDNFTALQRTLLLAFAWDERRG